MYCNSLSQILHCHLYSCTWMFRSSLPMFKLLLYSFCPSHFCIVLHLPYLLNVGDFQGQIILGLRTANSWRDSLGGGRTIREEAWGRWRERMVPSELLEGKETWEKHNRTCREDCFPGFLLILEPSEKKELKWWRMGLRKVLLCFMTGFICYWREITYKRRERQRDTRSRVGATKKKTYGAGGGRRRARRREHGMQWEHCWKH